MAARGFAMIRAKPQAAAGFDLNRPGDSADNTPMPQEYDLICLGCGPAGEKAATQAAYLNRRVAIVEQHSRPGGAMVNTGTIPSKTLRETALLCSAFHRRPLPGANRRPNENLSMTAFMARRHLVEQQEHDRIEQAIDRHTIDIHFGRGRVIDAHTVEVTKADGSTSRLSAKFILIATGSSPVRPAHVPFDERNVFDADGVLELERIPSSMLIVGGGVIGCEYASIFGEIDVKVTLIHTGDAILPFVDPECRQHLVDALTERGVQILANRAVKSVVIQGPGLVCVTFEDGASVCGESLLWAAGRQSNTHQLGLEEIGVKMGQRGLVLVNEHYQTNLPSIYAAGDVIGFPALAATSMEQGRVAACHMFGSDFKQKLTHLMPIGLYTIPAVSIIGMSMDDAVKAGREVVVGKALYRYNARGRMLGDEQGMIKCLFDRQSKALLGATIVGEDATELIHIAQSVMAFGGGVDYFIQTCFNYPSLAELYKYAAYSALQAIAMDESRKAA